MYTLRANVIYKKYININFCKHVITTQMYVFLVGHMITL